MRQDPLILTLDTEVDRKVALCILLPFLLSAFIVVFALFGAATQEFNYAVWVRKTSYLPAITELYRNFYRWGFALPVGLIILGVFLIRKPFCRLGGIMFFVGTEFVILTFWLAFSALAFYIGNQSFFVSIR